jgi:NlpC/P60 family putative phage cell wall peptidase
MSLGAKVLSTRLTRYLLNLRGGQANRPRFGEIRKAAARHLVAIDCAAFREGDVLLFRWRANLPAKHAAIVTAAEKMVHAHDGAAVAEVAIAPWWRRRLAYAFRFPGVA